MIDHVKPSERLTGRRATDTIRWGHLAVFLIVAFLAATGIIGSALDKVDERNAALLAKQAAQVVHQLKSSCGL